MATIQLNEKDLKTNLKRLINEYKDLIIESTTYTTKIKLPDGTNYLFAAGNTNKNTLIAASMIKRDVKNANFEPFEFKESVHYFNFNENIPYYLKECYCVDINSAYPTELKNRNLITEKTYKHLTNKIKKDERLKSLGMLATNKIIQTIENKKVVSIESKENKTACLFFSVSHKIGEILNEIFLSYPNYCYFFWVDGIFVKKEIINTVINTINENGFNCSVERVKGLKKKENYLIFDKYHYKKEIYENKIIFLPKKRARISQEIWNFIN